MAALSSIIGALSKAFLAPQKLNIAIVRSKRVSFGFLYLTKSTIDCIVNLQPNIIPKQPSASYIIAKRNTSAHTIAIPIPNPNNAPILADDLIFF